jgi:RimJ/RimL family protein N-acetyltransferase
MEILCRQLSGSNEDFSRMYKLKSLPDDIYWSGYKNPPDKINFATWFKTQLNRSDRKIWLSFDCCNPDTCVGYCYLTFETEEDNTVGVISIGVDKQFQGNGIGAAMVNFILNFIYNTKLSIGLLRAWIVKENISSTKSFLKNGFEKVEDTKQIFYASFGKEMNLDCYEFNFPGI